MKQSWLSAAGESHWAEFPIGQCHLSPSHPTWHCTFQHVQQSVRPRDHVQGGTQRKEEHFLSSPPSKYAPVLHTENKADSTGGSTCQLHRRQQGKGTSFKSQQEVSWGTLPSSHNPLSKCQWTSPPHHISISALFPFPYISSPFLLCFPPFSNTSPQIPPLPLSVSQGASVAMVALTPALTTEGVFWTVGSRADQVWWTVGVSTLCSFYMCSCHLSGKYMADDFISCSILPKPE